MTADLSRLPRAAKAYIHELETGLAERDARIEELTKRLDAPRSEKRAYFGERDQRFRLNVISGSD
ncbi:hypothetical protein [Burkholderia ubonensis]|uniref:hypothetical protein n=1 Tax=Burkholderia ubonensis TaxID=101571 RepID=UPI0009B39169|nr:hypothetical protein [Burkholderia ubonensis]